MEKEIPKLKQENPDNYTYWLKEILSRYVSQNV